MTQLSSVITTIAHAVQTLADGGGPFWNHEAESNLTPKESTASEADPDKLKPTPRDQ